MASKQVYKNANGVDAEVTLVNPDTNTDSKEIDLSKVVQSDDLGYIVTSAFDSLEEAFLNQGTILVDGQYEITSRITVLSNTRVIQTKDSYIKNIDTMETTNGTRPATDNGVFEVLNGSTNIIFDGLDLRGAWYGITRPFRDNNIAINISGRFDMENPYSDKYNTGVDALISTDIQVINCKIEGFAQSGVIADNINRFTALNNTITNCGRDGIRMYGCEEFIVDNNHIKNMSPGYDGIAPNLNVYGIAATSAYKQNPTSRPSSKGIVNGNTVLNCLTWKALDTHGGHDIVYSNNTCRNSHIGMGIDKGGYLDNGKFNPAKNIRVIGNSFINDQSDVELKRAGVTVFANSNDEDEIGQDIIISNNHIEGYGQDATDGAISLSMQNSVVVSGNNIVNNLRCGVFLANNVENCIVSDNIIRNIKESTLGIAEGVSVSNWVGECTINGNIFVSDNGDDFIPTKIYSSSVNEMYYGDSNIEKNISPVVGLINSIGGKVSATVGAGLILSSGTLSSGFNVTASKIDTGKYEVTVGNGDWTKLQPLVSAFASTGVVANIRNVAGNVITVYCYNGDGAALADTSFYIQINGYK